MRGGEWKECDLNLCLCVHVCVLSTPLTTFHLHLIQFDTYPSLCHTVCMCVCVWLRWGACLTSSALTVSWFHLDWPIHLRNKQEGTSTQMVNLTKSPSVCLIWGHVFRIDSTDSEQSHDICFMVISLFISNIYSEGRRTLICISVNVPGLASRQFWNPKKWQEKWETGGRY